MVFEEIVEDYKIQSDIGERILSQLSSMLPSIDNVNTEFSSNSNPNRIDDYNNNDMYLNYSSKKIDSFLKFNNFIF